MIWNSMDSAPSAIQKPTDLEEALLFSSLGNQTTMRFGA
jgi:hypothetical protein